MKKKRHLKDGIERIIKKIEKSLPYKAVLLIIAIAGFLSLCVIIFGCILVILFPPVVEYIIVDVQPHHLGDQNNSLLFPEAPNYESWFYRKEFRLPYLTEKMYIKMNTRDIDPKIDQAPAWLYINGKFVDFLNNYVTEERHTVNNQFLWNDAEMEIPVDPSFLKVGNNTIFIYVGKTKGEYDISLVYERELYQVPLENVDDIQFCDLKIKLEGSKI